jgi:hypothetical protein
MKQTKKSLRKIEQTVRKLTLQQLIILGFLALMAISYWWIKVHESSEISWNDSQIKLPSSELLQQQIDQQLSEQSQITNAPGANSDRIIDPQAMQIKLTGLTKNITTEKVPSTQELEGFFQKTNNSIGNSPIFNCRKSFFPTPNMAGRLMISQDRY